MSVEPRTENENKASEDKDDANEEPAAVEPERRNLWTAKALKENGLFCRMRNPMKIMCPMKLSTQSLSNQRHHRQQKCQNQHLQLDPPQPHHQQLLDLRHKTLSQFNQMLIQKSK